MLHAQVVASEMGATVTGVNEGNLRQYLLELMLAVVGGALAPPKFAVGLRACGVPPGEGTPLMLTDLLWCAQQLSRTFRNVCIGAVEPPLARFTTGGRHYACHPLSCDMCLPALGCSRKP